MCQDLSSEQIKCSFPEMSASTKLTYSVPFLRKLWGNVSFQKEKLSQGREKHEIQESQHKWEQKEISWKMDKGDAMMTRQRAQRWAVQNGWRGQSAARRLIWRHVLLPRKMSLIGTQKVKAKMLVTQWYPTLVTPWTAGHQAPLSFEFSRQEYWWG